MKVHFQPIQISSSHIGGGEKDGPRKKRRRVSVACRGCRTRKTRCDGGRPSCSTCLELGGDCVYEQPAYARESRGDQHLESRLQALEERVQSTPTDLNSQEPSSLRDSSQRTAAGDPHRNGSSPSLEYNLQLSPEDTNGPSVPQDAVDGMGAVLLTDDLEDYGYFGGQISILELIGPSVDVSGASSNIALFKRVSRAVAQIANIHGPRKRFAEEFPLFRRSWHQSPSPVSPSPSEPSNEQERHSKRHLSALPTDAEALMLIQEYFGTVGLMLPCVHEDSFLALYKQAQRMNYKGVRRSWLAMLNMIFALASNTMAATSPIRTVARMSEIYYQRALGIATPDVFANTSLEIVQLLSLMETYLQGTQRSMQAWTFHGLAVKAALQLGLHSTEASKKLPLLEREMRKRTWYWCIINDCILSVKFGRPPMIPNSLIKMDLPCNINNEFPAANVSSALISTSVTYYNALIKLSIIMSETLDQLYDQNLGSSTSLTSYDTITRSFALCWKLAEWQRALPPNLRLMISSEMLYGENLSLENTRFRMLMSLRYLGARVLATRPILLRFLDFDVESKGEDHELALLRDAGASALRDCIHTCTEVILIVGMIFNEFKNDRNLMGAWWYSTYYTFNASLVIFGVLLACFEPRFTGLFTPASVDEMRSSLDKAAEVLKGLDNGNIMISRCRECLKRLLDMYDSMHTSPKQIFEQANLDRLSDQTSRSTAPSLARTLATGASAGQRGLHADYISTPGGYGVDASSYDMDMGFGSFGGLVMSSDFEFLGTS